MAKSWPRCTKGAVIAPSLLAADFGHLADAVRGLRESGADRLHIDVMDGDFVPNFTFGTDTLRHLRGETDLPFEVHLMIGEPERHLRTFAEAGADAMTVHWEACPHLHRTLHQIRELGCRAGGAVNVSTPIVALVDVLDAMDLALVMTVDPGFGGQSLVPRTLAKVAQLRREIDAQGVEVELEVDGGLEPHNAAACVAAGATVLVAGTSVFRAEGGPAAGVTRLLGALSGEAGQRRS
jgi:ribulose-phosphate 3-epimerase